MRVLLDTHAFLWAISDPGLLSSAALTAIRNGGNDVLVSIVTPWEIAIKVSIGKLTLSEKFDVLLPREIAANNFRLLGVELAHTAAVIALPYHHRDPFDRLLIAQALVEAIPIISADGLFDAYGVSRIW
jgi:PIN domain nuclease of toxin-antitoxin system